MESTNSYIISSSTSVAYISIKSSLIRFNDISLIMVDDIPKYGLCSLKWIILYKYNKIIIANKYLKYPHLF